MQTRNKLLRTICKCMGLGAIGPWFCCAMCIPQALANCVQSVQKYVQYVLLCNLQCASLRPWSIVQSKCVRLTDQGAWHTSSCGMHSNAKQCVVQYKYDSSMIQWNTLDFSKPFELQHNPNRCSMIYWNTFNAMQFKKNVVQFNKMRPSTALQNEAHLLFLIGMHCIDLNTDGLAYYAMHS